MNKLNLPTQEWISLGKGALIAGAGAGLAYLSQNVTGTDFGIATPVIVALCDLKRGEPHIKPLMHFER